jgi:hypothetical protein
MSVRYPDNDNELRQAVRAETSYDDTPDELPQSQLSDIVERAKAKVELETGSESWFTDDGLGFALVAYTAMRAKASIENVPLSGYSLGDERVSFDQSDPEDSQQLQQWAEDVSTGLDASSADSAVGPVPTNTSGYIGDTYLERDPYDDRRGAY